MGLQSITTKDLVVVDVAKLQCTIEQILAELTAQGETSAAQSEALAAQDRRMQALQKRVVHELGDADHPSSVSSRAQVEAKQAEHLDLLLGLNKRLEKEISKWEDHAKAVHERASAIEARVVEAEIRIGRAEASLGVVDQLRQELAQTCKVVEARVHQAEMKASECRQEAKEHGSLFEDHTAAIARIEERIIAISKLTQSLEIQVESLDGIGSSDKALRELSQVFEVSLRKLEKDLHSKAGASAMDAMRKDMERSICVLHDAINNLRERICISDATREANDMKRPKWTALTKMVDASEQSEQTIDGDLHCLVCGSAPRSASPLLSKTIEEGNTTSSSTSFVDANSSGRTVVRPPLTAPSIPRASSTPQILYTAPQSSSRACAAAVAGSAPREKVVRGGTASRPSSRPSSAGRSRPSSAGAQPVSAGTQKWASPPSAPLAAGCDRQPIQGSNGDGLSPASAKDNLPISMYLGINPWQQQASPVNEQRPPLPFLNPKSDAQLVEHSSNAEVAGLAAER